jgi:SAM-dependent methyltransferase
MAATETGASGTDASARSSAGTAATVMTERTTASLVHEALERAFAAAEKQPHPIAALDAGCGRLSALQPYRPRIARFVGADIHEPASPLPYLDEFHTVDLCTEPGAFAGGSFDVALSSFTIEHFADPPAALRNIHAWLRPGGRLVVTTVNRRHPFVRVYLSLPAQLRTRAQRLVKATHADAHPLVGACTTPAEIRSALTEAGYTDIVVQTVGHLTAAWGRRSWSRAIGALGDRLTARLPSRRSTIVAWATARAAEGTSSGQRAGG